MTTRPTPRSNPTTPRKDQLLKVLEQEARTGYQDRAVFGGLDRLLATVMQDDRSWPAPAHAYRDLTADERALWASQVLVWLTTSAEKPSAPAKKPARRPIPSTGSGNGLPSTKSPEKLPAAAQAKSRATPIRRTTAATLATRIALLPGVRKDVAAKLEKLGVLTIRDALLYYPSRHIDFTKQVPIAQLEPGQEQTISGFVWEAREGRLGPRMRSAEVIIGDDTGNVRAVWFNQPYLVRYFKQGAKVFLSGKVGVWRGQKVFENPEYEMAEGDEDDLVHTGRLVPVYPLTEGLSNRTVRRLIKPLVDTWAPQLDDPLPDALRRLHNFMALSPAVQSAHYPPSLDALEEARQRLAYDELLSLQLGAFRARQQWQQEPGFALTKGKDTLDGFVASLPFALTGAQQRVLKEIVADLRSPQPMSRLLQGDVGSGKTVIAAAALLLAVSNGHQGAIMAPTEILAEQHYRSLSKLFGAPTFETEEALAVPYLMLGDRPLRVGLLVGSLSAKEKEARQQEVARGEIDILVGTQALIQEKVSFSSLAVAVIDEQHRFGVAQRASLRQKGHNPHVLVMSATPIPRSLALTLYGDLENSILDELPPGRQVIATKAALPMQRDMAYEFVREQVGEGSQAFVICPLIDESKVMEEMKAATVEYQRLSTYVFPNLRLGLLHGRMSPAEKEDVMQRFYRHELDILVSTTVIEVGIDVPNATVMLIEGADRFGLAQLHQLRGRVGRGSRQSYCVLLTENSSPDVAQRLAIMESTPDGFKIAEEDLRLRGPGEFFGTRQTGLPELRMARLEDWALLQAAREDARTVLTDDPALDKPENAGLRTMLPALPRRRQTEIS